MPDEYCEQCEYYDVGDTCDECFKRRHKRIVLHDDMYYDLDEDSIDEDECGDGYFNE